jgi:adenylosuccinate synthase
MDGWDEDLTKIKNQNEFPDKFKDYFKFLEKELQVPIKIISVGPDRNQTIHVD